MSTYTPCLIFEIDCSQRLSYSPCPPLLLTIIKNDWVDDLRFGWGARDVFYCADSNPLLFQCDANVVRIIGNNHLSFQNFLATLTRHSLEANMMLLHSYYLMKMFILCLKASTYHPISYYQNIRSVSLHSHWLAFVTTPKTRV